MIVSNLAIVSTWIIRALGNHEQSREMEDFLSTVFPDDPPHRISLTTTVSSFGRILSGGSRVFRARRITNVHDLEEQRGRSRSRSRSLGRRRTRRGAEYGAHTHHIVLEEESKTEELDAELSVPVLERHCGMGLETGSECLTTLSSALKESMHTSSFTLVESESPLPPSHPSPVYSLPSSGCVCAIEDGA